MSYTYIKEVNSGRLTKEIQASTITVALNYIETNGATGEVIIHFKAALSVSEETTLSSLVTNHTPTPLPPGPSEVVTQLEKNDKVLRCFSVMTNTDAVGVAEFCIPVPAGGRWIAYGDAEFENRNMGDHISIIEITDLDRHIAWQMAWGINPTATAPVADSVVQSAGTFPLYPVIGHYDERSFPSPMPANAKGTIKKGMAMTFQYGVTEAQPIGGYGFIPEGFYLRIVCQKADGFTAAGQKCQLSIDWAENG